MSPLGYYGAYATAFVGALSMTSRWDRAAKNTVRECIVKSRAVRARTAKWLCGEDMLDVALALRCGVIDRRTFNVFTERDPVICERILSNPVFSRFTTRPYLHRGHLQCLDMAPILGRRRIDFANLDFCGSLDYWIVRWLGRLSLDRLLSRGATVAMTMFLPWRKDPFAETFWNYAPGAEGYRAITTQSELQLRVERNLRMFQNIRIRYETVLAALWAYEIRLHDVFRYHDTSSMVTYVMSCWPNRCQTEVETRRGFYENLLTAAAARAPDFRNYPTTTELAA